MTTPDVGDPTRPAVTNQLRLPRTTVLGPGRGGQQRLLIDVPAGAAEIYLHGATVTSWVPRGGLKIIFTSRQAISDGATATHGGIPLCLLEFGVDINGDAVLKHGWVRIAPWRLPTVTSADGGGVRALLSASRNRLTTLYEVEVGQTPRLELGLRNEDGELRTVEVATHTYPPVHDVTASCISGLVGVPYNDNLTRSPQEAHHVQEGGVTIHGPVDRIYGSAESITVTDPEYQRAIGIDKRNAPSTTVWNPWSTHGAPLPGMIDDGFPAMVCIESGTIRGHAPTIAPGANWSMQMTVSVESTAM